MRRMIQQRHDRGASAVMTALVITVCLGCVAISVDVGIIWSDKTQLQSGADAAAIAVATDCSKGACGDYQTTAAALAKSNKLDSNAKVESVTIDEAAYTVTVVTSSVRENTFARILNVNTTSVTATAVAKWTPPPPPPPPAPAPGPGGGSSSSTALTLSANDYNAMTSFGTKFPTTAKRFYSRSGSSGFGWLKSPPLTTFGTGCTNTTTGYVAMPVASGSGDEPTECWTNPAVFYNRSAVSTKPGSPIQISIWNQFYSAGAESGYNVCCLAHFAVTAFHLKKAYSSKEGGGVDNFNTTDTGASNWVEGYFVSGAGTTTTTSPTAMPTEPATPTVGSGGVTLVK